MNHVEHIYIHIPFCTHICAYCDFVKSRYHHQLADKVIERLIDDIAHIDSKSIKTLYIGGGTPSALSFDQLDLLCQTISKRWPSILEWSVEINPEDMTFEKMSLLAKHGVNRLSMGVQATQQRLLEIITRHHNFEDVKRVTGWAHECGITNISYDLMYGLPTQTIEEFEASMHEVLTLNPTHLSLYALTIEPNTAFGRQKVQPVDNELEGQMYECAISTLTQAGYEHYEVSSFTKNQHYSKHNLSYWKYANFIGIGPGAASKVNNRRWTNTKNIHHYTLNEKLIQEDIQLSDTDQIIEKLMMGLRLNQIVLWSHVNHRDDARSIIEKVLEKTQQQGWVIMNDEGIQSTSSGRLFLHDIIVTIMQAFDEK
ncbi:MAG: radical SAM family heme chaperone HemW [Erysipelothrix sp.]|jgi:oxygen-independent coproporphyrinogen-3 oxidase|nr:radical SAM family heme chaperone HemW [Erysipelothrix sp.]